MVETTHNSSMLGWKILFINPIEGDLYGYWSGSSTCIFHTPPANGAEVRTQTCEPHRFWRQKYLLLTLLRAMKADIELLDIIVHEGDLVV